MLETHYIMMWLVPMLVESPVFLLWVVYTVKK